jgi:putative FmdB family regulatory protein
MPLFDFKCPACGRVTEQLIKSSEDQVWCYNCDTIMERQLPAPYGKITGYSYSNGYSKKKGNN